MVNGVHDMGGMDGLGPLEIEEDEPFDQDEAFRALEVCLSKLRDHDPSARFR